MERISFKKKAISVPAEYRPMYMVSLVSLILMKVCVGSKAELLKLHLFTWVFKDKSNAQILKNYINSNFTNDIHVWGIEPNLNRALVYSVAEGYVLFSNKKYILTEKGKNLVSKIRQDNELFQEEIEFLDWVGKSKITESRIQAITKKWKDLNVIY